MDVSGKKTDEQDSTSMAKSQSRRSVLKLATAAVAVTSVPFGATAAASATASTSTVADDFSFVSTFLTGKASLDPDIEAALLKAFAALDTGFGAKLAALRTAITKDNVTAENLHETLSANDPDLANLPQAILAGWYLGVAGSGKHAICVTYANDLANAAVSDVLSPPSYAYGPCNSWAQKPI